MTNTEEVRKILCRKVLVVCQGMPIDTYLPDKLVVKWGDEINQLYNEPQPDQGEIERDKISKSNAVGMGLISGDEPDQSSRLLTDDEIHTAGEFQFVPPEGGRYGVVSLLMKGRNIAKAQRDLTASIKDARYRQAVKDDREGKPLDLTEEEFEIYSSIQSATTIKEAARIEAFIKEIDGIFSLPFPENKWRYIREEYLKANPTSEVEG